MNMPWFLGALSLVLCVGATGRGLAESSPRCSTLRITTAPELRASAGLATLEESLPKLMQLRLVQETNPTLYLEVGATSDHRFVAKLQAWADELATEVQSDKRASIFSAYEGRYVLQPLSKASLASFHRAVEELIRQKLETHQAWIGVEAKPPEGIIQLTKPSWLKPPTGVDFAAMGCLPVGTRIAGNVKFASDKPVEFQVEAELSGGKRIVAPPPPPPLPPPPEPEPEPNPLDALLKWFKELPEWLLAFALALLALFGAILFPRTYRPRMHASTTRASFDADGFCARLDLQIVNKNPRVRDIPELHVRVGPESRRGANAHSETRQPSATEPELLEVPVRRLAEWKLRDGDSVQISLRGSYAPSWLPVTLRFTSPLQQLQVRADDPCPATS